MVRGLGIPVEGARQSAMNEKAETTIAIAVVVFILVAVVFAGLGGLVEHERERMALAACSGASLLMLFVPWVFVAAKPLSVLTNMWIATAYGAVGGLCYGLCFHEGAGFPGLLEKTAFGGVLGFASFWMSWLRYSWRSSR